MRPAAFRRGAVAAALLLLVGILVTTTASAQDRPPMQRPQPTVELQIASISPWVDSEGEFQVRFEPSPDVPADAQLSVTLHQAIETSRSTSLRSSIEQVMEGANPGRILRTLPPRPIIELGDPAVGTVLSIPIRGSRGDSDRVLVPNPGVHPVELVLTRSDGPELWRRTVFLNRLPVAPSSPMGVALVLPVGTGPSLSPDGAPAFDPAATAALQRVSGLLESVPDPPVVLAVEPNTLDGLDAVADPWATELTERLRTVAASRPTLQRTYVPVDAGSMVASDGAAQLSEQIVFGRSRITRHLGTTPVTDVWGLDATVTGAALPTLAAVGVRTMFVTPDQLELPRDVTADDLLSTPASVASMPSISVIAADEAAAEALTRPDSEPAVQANDALTMLIASWFDQRSATTDDDRYLVVELPSDLEASTLDAVGAALRSDGPLTAVTAAQLSTGDVATPTGPAVTVTTEATVDMADFIRHSAEMKSQIDAYAGMTSGADPIADLWTNLLFQSFDRSLDTVDRAVFDETIAVGLADRISQIHAPLERRVVLTSADPVIPLRFRNDLDFDVRLRMEIRSARLDVTSVSEIVLVPGENRIDIPVTVRAAGESLLRIELSSPDGVLGIPGSEVPVRSTAISGVGAALSAVSIVFLLGWWARTYARSRRRDEEVAAELDDDAPSPDGAPPPDGDADGARPAPSDGTDSVDARG